MFWIVLIVIIILVALYKMGTSTGNSSICESVEFEKKSDNIPNYDSIVRELKISIDNTIAMIENEQTPNHVKCITKEYTVDYTDNYIIFPNGNKADFRANGYMLSKETKSDLCELLNREGHRYAMSKGCVDFNFEHIDCYDYEYYQYCIKRNNKNFVPAKMV